MKIFILCLIANIFTISIFAQSNLYDDLLLNINKFSENQKNRDEEIFKTYGREPYIPNKIDPTLSFEISKKKLNLYVRKFLLKRGDQPAYLNEQTHIGYDRVKNVIVTDDYLQFTKPNPRLSTDTTTIYFKDVLNYPVIYFSPWKNDINVYTKVKNHIFGSAIIELPDVIYYIQQHYAKKYYIDEYENFKNRPDLLTLANTKIILTEELRKYIVQANSIAEKGDYFKSLELYEKAMQLDPFSYPIAYYNMALVAAELKLFNYAVFNMKKYLLIQPDSPETRKVQDKIYEWEINSPLTK